MSQPIISHIYHSESEGTTALSQIEVNRSQPQVCTAHSFQRFCTSAKALRMAWKPLGNKITSAALEDIALRSQTHESFPPNASRWRGSSITARLCPPAVKRATTRKAASKVLRCIVWTEGRGIFVARVPWPRECLSKRGGIQCSGMDIPGYCFACILLDVDVDTFTLHQHAHCCVFLPNFTHKHTYVLLEMILALCHHLWINPNT